MKLQKIKETGGLHGDNKVHDFNTLNLGDVTDYATHDPIQTSAQNPEKQALPINNQQEEEEEDPGLVELFYPDTAGFGRKVLDPTQDYNIEADRLA